MQKRPITLDLDEDVVEALEALGKAGSSLSPAANAALRETLKSEEHRVALLEWLDELDAEYGAPTPEQLAAARALWEELEGSNTPGSEARAA